MSRAGSRTPSLPVPVAVVATTHQIQTGPSTIPLDKPPGESEIIVSIRQGSGYLLESSSVCPTVHGSTCQVSIVSLHENLVNLCDTLAFTVLSYSEVWGELLLPLQKQVAQLLTTTDSAIYYP